MAMARKPLFKRPSPHWFHDDCEAPPRLPPGHLQRRNEAVVLDEEGRVKLEAQELTLLRGVLHKYVS